MIEKPRISSKKLGIHAYERALGRRSAPRPAAPVMSPRHSAPAAHPQRSEKATRELKVSVLKSLQNQSNAGLVKMRDVASALDDHLKKS